MYRYICVPANLCQLDQARVVWEAGTSGETIPPIRLAGGRQTCDAFSTLWEMHLGKTLFTVGNAIHGLLVLTAIRQQAEQAMREEARKQSLLQFVCPGSCLESCPDLTCVVTCPKLYDQTNPFLSRLLFSTAEAAAAGFSLSSQKHHVLFDAESSH